MCGCSSGHLVLSHLGWVSWTLFFSDQKMHRSCLTCYLTWSTLWTRNWKVSVIRVRDVSMTTLCVVVLGWSWRFVVSPNREAWHVHVGSLCQDGRVSAKGSCRLCGLCHGELGHSPLLHMSNTYSSSAIFIPDRTSFLAPHAHKCCIGVSIVMMYPELLFKMDACIRMIVVQPPHWTCYLRRVYACYLWHGDPTAQCNRGLVCVPLHWIMHTHVKGTDAQLCQTYAAVSHRN